MNAIRRIHRIRRIHQRRSMSFISPTAPTRTGNGLALLRITLCGVALLGAAQPPVAHAQPGKEKDPLSWDRSVQRLFRSHCYRCHNPDEDSGGIDLASDVDPRLILAHRDKWQQVDEALRSGMMPPKDASPRLDDANRELMLKYLDETINKIDCEHLDDPGPPPLRRLNRTEYDNAIEDLTGLRLRIAEETFSPDPTSFGFDNIGPALSFTPVQVEQYHAAARAVVKAVTSSRDDSPQLYAKLFGEHSPPDATPIETVRQLAQGWCDAAFRRPAGSAIVDKLLAIYRQSRAAEESHELAMGHVLTGILMSPQFLIRIEQNRGETPYRVDDYELASRLSFFLWSRPPDAQLLELAAAGKLGEPEVLARETRRMLRDAKSNALVKNFFGQWLGLRTLETHVVDADAFPAFNNELRRSMIAETDAFLAALIVDDRPITELIDADYTFVDQRLAQFYGLTDATVSADGAPRPPVRIALKDRRRGGILTSAALLTLLADPNRTNIPRRGNYIADRILGMAPPPPPPNVPELEVARDGKPVPLRELFEKHRAQAACASCHARIDPFGFSLEQFDAIGRWRTTDAGQPIDASGNLPDGEALNGIVSLKDLLMSRKEEFGRSMAKNLLIYALGRGPELGDPCVIDDMARAGAEHDWKFSELVLTIVNSRPFLYRRNPD